MKWKAAQKTVHRSLNQSLVKARVSKKFMEAGIVKDDTLSSRPICNQCRRRTGERLAVTECHGLMKRLAYEQLTRLPDY
jgi:hypothetical protein